MSLRRFAVCGVLLLTTFCLAITGCNTSTQNSGTKKQLTISIKTPPIGLGNVPDVGDVEIYDLFVAATEKFSAQYDKYDLTFDVSRYSYHDEQEQLADKYGTEEAADIFYSGSWNMPTYAAKGWIVGLDDIINEELSADIDKKIWEQSTIDGTVYVMPFQQFQNTLLVNRDMMEAAGLSRYIPEKNTIAYWSTAEFDLIFRELKNAISDENKFAFMMYAANNQGDTHIMTLLRSFGGTLYNVDGNFCVNTPEGIRALEWIKSLDDQGITPKGSENLQLQDCVNLSYNGQIAICIGNYLNLWDAQNKGLDVFAVNFPSLDGNGYCTSSSNGFCVFDNGDADKIQAAKDFIRFIYANEELMKYSVGTLPVNRSVSEAYQDEYPMMKAYSDNVGNTVDNIRNNLGWQGVRDVFYPNIRDLLMGNKTPEEIAAAIDNDCNLALKQGRNIANN